MEFNEKDALSAIAFSIVVGVLILIPKEVSMTILVTAAIFSAVFFVGGHLRYWVQKMKGE